MAARVETSSPVDPFALIGFGAIGGELARLMRREAGALPAAILLRESSAAPPAPWDALVARSPEALLASPARVVVECAGHAAVREHGARVLRSGRDLLVVSSGALADDALMGELLAAARDGDATLQVAAGAVGGLDILAAARLAGLDRVRYRSRKPPGAWKGTPAERAADLDSLDRPTVVYSGTAREAARLFPKNANVTATVALATLGLDRTEVELVADPGTAHNVHEVEAEGRSGRIAMSFEGRPSPDNPRTSMITAFSVARCLLDRRAALRVG